MLVPYLILGALLALMSMEYKLLDLCEIRVSCLSSGLLGQAFAQNRRDLTKNHFLVLGKLNGYYYQNG